MGKVDTVIVAHPSGKGQMIINADEYNKAMHGPVLKAPKEKAPKADPDAVQSTGGEQADLGPTDSTQSSTPKGDGLDELTVKDLRAKVKEAGIKLADITGTGDGGNVVKGDLVTALRAHVAPAAE